MEIYFTDLNETAQQEYAEFLGYKTVAEYKNDANYESFSITTVCKDED
jgi:hypothetical protein